MAPRALVTGGAGFAGQWLIRALLRRGHAVTSVSQAAHPSIPVLDARESASVRWLADDLTQPTSIRRIILEERPELIVHLAAVSHVPAGEDAPVLTFEVNVLGCARLLAEVRRARTDGAYDPVVLVIGSGEQYGRQPAEAFPLDETTAQLPLTQYAASKAAQEVIALQAARAERMRVVAIRSFNHSGPGQAPHFLLPSLVQRALALPRSGGRLTLGNEAVQRDFLHVADVVDAYCLLAERGVPGEAYNVASGEGVTVRSLAERVLQRLGVTAEIVSDPALVRPVDVPTLIGSPAKLRALTGWTPRLTRDAIIDDLIRTAGTADATP